MRRFKISLFLIFFAALLIRLSLILIAHHGDLNNNISWGTIAYEKGLNGFYEGYINRSCTTALGGDCGQKVIKNWPYSAPNQPPLTIEMFAVTRFIWQKLRDFFWYMNWTLLIFPSKLIWFWDDKGMDLLVKLPSVIADLGIGLIIYRYLGKKKEISDKTATFITGLWLFNPVILYNSTVWGQTDSIVNFLGLVGIIALLRKNFKTFAVFLTLSLLFKASLAVFIPVLLIVAIKQKYPVKNWIISVIYSVLTVIVISVWFHPGPDLILWIAKLYYVQILPGEIGFLTANAFNLWWLINPGKVMDSTLFLGIQLRFWGYLVFVTGIIAIIKWLSKKITEERILFSLALSALISFLFMTRIHERYIYPFFPPATLITAFYPGLLFPYILYSMINLLNLYNLFWAPQIPVIVSLLGNARFTDILSIINLLLFFYFLRRFKVAKT